VRVLRTYSLAFFLLLFSGCGEHPVVDGGESSKILSGTALPAGTSPQMAQVQVLQPDGRSSLCSGVAIGASSILTAGHCFRNGSVLVSIVRDDGSSVQARNFALHPGYVEDLELGAIFNDLAVVNTGAPHGLPTLPVASPSSPAPVVGDTLTVFGFGQNDSGVIGALATGDVAVDLVTPSHLMSVYRGEGSNPCFGDSGGPAIRFGDDGTPSIVGVVSTGSASDCGEGDLTLFTNIQSEEAISFLVLAVPDLAIH